MNIYIGNFSYDLTEDELHQVFSAYGNVESAKIIKNNSTGNSRGFGFVQMPDRKAALSPPSTASLKRCAFPYLML